MKWALFLCLFVLVACAKPTTFGNSVSQTNLTSIFPIEYGGNPALLTYSSDLKQVSLETVTEGKLQEITSAAAIGNVWGASTLKVDNAERIAVAYGYGRGDLSAPVRIVLYDQNLEHPETIFTAQSERSEVTFFGLVNDKLFINYFTDKYHTKGGYLDHAAGAWTFTETNTERLGIHLAFDGDIEYIGRPYGDTLESDGDLLRVQGTQTMHLPTFRGVSSVALAQLDDDPEQEILIGDGWHKNYGKLAEPRLSLVDRGTGEYTVRVIDTAKPQYAILQIIPIMVDEKTHVLARGDLSIGLYDPEDGWKKQTVYQRTGDKFSPFGMAYLGQAEGQIQLAVLDGGLSLKQVALSVRSSSGAP